MVYNIKIKSHFIGSITEDTIRIVFNPKIQNLYIGDSIKIINEKQQGVVAQIYQIEHLSMAKIKEAKIEHQLGNLEEIISDDNHSLHIAECKVKRTISDNKWLNWRGNLPAFDDEIRIVTTEELLSHTTGSNPLNCMTIGNYPNKTPVPVKIEAGLLERNNLIIGNKNSEKANLISILLKELNTKNAKTIVIDPKGIYNTLKDTLLAEAGKTLKISLEEYGFSNFWELIVDKIEPPVLSRTENLFNQLIEYIQTLSVDFISIDTLINTLDKNLNQPEGPQSYKEVVSLKKVLKDCKKLDLFATNKAEICSISSLFTKSNSIVIDLSNLNNDWKAIYLNRILKDLIKSEICSFVFYEDIHHYIDEKLISTIMYRSRNSGINNFFITDYESDIPSELIKESDNFFMFSKDSLKNAVKLYKNLSVDSKLLSRLLKYLPESTMIINGEISNNYPIFIELKDCSKNFISKKHFGSIKKYFSNNGDIIYSYKNIEDAQAVLTINKEEVPSEINYFSMFKQDNQTQTSQINTREESITEPQFIEKETTISKEIMEDVYNISEEEYEEYSDVESIYSTFAKEVQEKEKHLYTPPIVKTFSEEVSTEEEYTPTEYIEETEEETEVFEDIYKEEPIEPAHFEEVEEEVEIEIEEEEEEETESFIGIYEEETFEPIQFEEEPVIEEAIEEEEEEEEETEPFVDIYEEEPTEPIHEQEEIESFVDIYEEESAEPPQFEEEEEEEEVESFEDIYTEEPTTPDYYEEKTQIKRQEPKIEFDTEELIEEFDQELEVEEEYIEEKTYTKEPEKEKEPKRTILPQKPKIDLPEEIQDIPIYATHKLSGQQEVEFKEGDKVHHERYGIGVINRIIATGDKILCSIQFQDFGRRLLDPKRGIKKIS